MPYIDKKLKSEYQKRTATPYMKEWRERNRENHREYMRNWAAKRRANSEKKRQDKETAVKTGAYEKWKNYNKRRQKDFVENIADIYVIGLLARHKSLTRKLARETPEILELHKQILLTKRKLKNK